jgi:myosin heavy subunit
MAQVGDKVWVPHSEQAWVCGKITKLNGNDSEISCELGKIKMTQKQIQGLEHCGSHVADDVENLVDLDELSEVCIYVRFNINQTISLLGSYFAPRPKKI